MLNLTFSLTRNALCNNNSHGTVKDNVRTKLTIYLCCVYREIYEALGYIDQDE